MDIQEKNYKFSIITVTFNCKNTIERTIQSVLKQSYKNFEYIIKDGASSDGTKDIIEKYQSSIKLVSDPDNGIYDAMNQAMSLASGDFLIFLGGDDCFYSNDVLSQVASSISEYDVLYYGDVFIPQLNKRYWGRFDNYKFAIGNICHQAIFYPKSIYKKYVFDLRYKVYADYIYNIQLFKHYKFQYIDIVISYFDLMGTSSRVEDYQYSKDIAKIIINNFGILPYSCRLLYHTMRKMKNILFGIHRR